MFAKGLCYRDYSHAMEAITDMPDDEDDLRAVAHFLKFSQFPDNVVDEAKRRIKKLAMKYCVRKTA